MEEAGPSLPLVAAQDEVPPLAVSVEAQEARACAEYVPATLETCGLWGCTLSRLHSGLCNVGVSTGRERKRPRVFEGGPADPPSKLYEAARAAGRVPPKSSKPPKAKVERKRATTTAAKPTSATAGRCSPFFHAHQHFTLARVRRTRRAV